MSEAAWIGVAAVVPVAALLLVVLAIQGRAGRRRFPTRLDGVRIEALPAQCVEDLVLEKVWRIPLGMPNLTGRPAPVPPLAARSEIRTARRTFATSTSLEADIDELNPGVEVAEWVEARLPGEDTPHRVTLAVLGDEQRRPLALTALLRAARPRRRIGGLCRGVAG